MNELQAIVALADRTGQECALALATVMRVQGSTYRRPGARMLLTANGATAGIISGGCLESDVRERARQVMATGCAQIVTYDSTAPDDIVFGLGLGCNGIVHVLIEPLATGDETGMLAFLRASHQRRQEGRVVTALPCDRPAVGPVAIHRVMQWPDGTLINRSTDVTLSTLLMQEMVRAAEGRAGARRIDGQDGNQYDLLIETIAPPTSLVLFGAGDDAIPVARGAKLLGWEVTVIDARPAYATQDRFSDADAVLCIHPESLGIALHECKQIPLSPSSLAMVMTHNYLQDREILRQLLPFPLRYIGVLGPKARTQRLLDELAGEGVDLSGDAISRLHGPAGLDIGAETPEEIALALLAEMQAALTRHHGGPLRERNSGIHDDA